MQAAVRRSQRRKHFGKSEGAARGDVAVVMGPQGLVKVRLVARRLRAPINSTF
jgi:hypothetical protein